MDRENKVISKDNAIISEIAKALVAHGANSDIISIVASWKDTLDDKDVLSYLKEWNAKKQLSHR